MINLNGECYQLIFYGVLFDQVDKNQHSLIKWVNFIISAFCNSGEKSNSTLKFCH